MGVLYWQFNTDYQGPSWSTLDSSGNWKPSHNMVKQLYSPLIVSAFFSNPSNLHVQLVSDQQQSGKAVFLDEAHNWKPLR